MPIPSIIVAGQQWSGKTQLCRALVTESYQEKYLGTIGLDFFYYPNKNKPTLHIYDLSSDDRFQRVYLNQYRSATTILYCVDLSQPYDEQGLLNAIATIKQHSCSPNIIFVGTKADECLKETSEWLQNVAEQQHAQCMMTSAKTRDGVDALLETLKSLPASKQDQAIAYDPSSQQPDFITYQAPSNFNLPPPSKKHTSWATTAVIYTAPTAITFSTAFLLCLLLSTGLPFFAVILIPLALAGAVFLLTLATLTLIGRMKMETPSNRQFDQPESLSTSLDVSPSERLSPQRPLEDPSAQNTTPQAPGRTTFFSEQHDATTPADRQTPGPMR